MVKERVSFKSPTKALSVGAWFRLIGRYGGRCAYCGAEFVEDTPDCDYGGLACLDHIEPASKGGTDDEHNLAPCCRRCNSAKGKKSLEEFRALRCRKLGVESHTFWFEGING